MAQAGFTPIRLYYSTTASAVPTAINLTDGELAINITDGKLYYKDNSGVVQLLASNAATTNVSAISFGTTGLTPATSTSGAVTVAGTLGVSNGGTGQTTYTDGQLLIGNTTGNTLTKATLTAGSNISITNGAGSITIASTGGSGTVTSITAGTGLTGGTITTSGTIAIDSTVVTLTGTQTLTNKTITQRVSSTTSISSPLAWNSDNFDIYAATAQAGALTINADSGTPTDGRRINFRLTCDGTARTITFTGGSSKSFKPVGPVLTVSGSNFTYTLTINKTTYFGAIYNAASDRWEIVALSQEA